MKRFALTLFTVFLCLTGCSPPASQVSEEPASPSPAADALSTVSAEATPSPTPSPTPEPTPEPYCFGTPVPLREDVDDDWFSDAVFLGDSRTEGLEVFSGIHGGDFFWDRGMSVFRVDNPDYRVIEIDGEKLTVMEALAAKQYGKVYIMIGVNELGYPVGSYEKGLAAMVDKAKEIQPDAMIYLQTIPPVNEAEAQSSGLGSYVNNTNVNAFNDVIVRIAAEKEVALLDTAVIFRSDEGDLPADLAADGVHFRKEGYQLWAEYLRCHTLTMEEYQNGQPSAETPESGETSTEDPAPNDDEIPAESGGGTTDRPVSAAESEEGSETE